MPSVESFWDKNAKCQHLGFSIEELLNCGIFCNLLDDFGLLLTIGIGAAFCTGSISSGRIKGLSDRILLLLLGVSTRGMLIVGRLYPVSSSSPPPSSS